MEKDFIKALPNEDKIFVGQVLDKLKGADKGVPQYTKFLDPHKTGVATSICRHYNVEFQCFGGYDEAERCVLAVLPDYPMTPEFPITVLKFTGTANGFSKELTHRDFLGSVLGLMISRDLIGDILVFDDFAYMWVMNSISEFICINLTKVGKNNVCIEKVDEENIVLPEVKTIEISGTVASMRLDCVLAEVFKISRTKINDMITSGQVALNHVECLDNKKEVKQNDIISMRRFGRFTITHIGTKNKKGNTRITANKQV